MRCPGEDSKRPREEEELAREFLRGHLRGELFHVDPPDFVLCRDGVVVGGLEVTLATRQESQRLEARLSRGGRSFGTDLLRMNWMVTFESTANLRVLDRDRLVDTLVLLERDTTGASVSGYNRRAQRQLALVALDEATEAEATQLLREFGVDRAAPLGDCTETATIYLGERGFGGFADLNLVNRLAEEIFTRKQGVLRGVAGERHLFVWVDPREPIGAGIAMGNGTELPETSPKFPPWVNDVWMVNTFGDGHLWHCSSRGSWEVLERHPT